MKSLLYRAMYSALSPGGARGKLSILVFHKIASVADPLAPDDMQLAGFERILDFLAEHTRVLPLREARHALLRGTLPSRTVALTFDDGYHDWLDTVAPALRRRQMHGTFFVSTEQIDGAALWHERVVAAVRALPDAQARLSYGFGAFADLSRPERRLALIAALQARLKYLGLAQRREAIELLEAQAVSALLLPRRFDVAAVRALHNQGFDIGAHTIDHPILTECSRAEALAEIGGSREQLAHIVGGPVQLFAYPNGKPGRDYSQEHVALVRDCGYEAAVTTSSGVASAASDQYQLPRFAPWEQGTTARLAYQIGRNMRAPDRRLPPLAPASATTGAATPVRALLIASTFAPLHGGSAVVYENLCLEMPRGSIRVLTASRNYLNQAEIEGWREHDAAAPYPIDRIALLRPPLLPAPAHLLVSLWRLLFHDLALYASTFWRAARLVRRHRINIVVVGELVTGSWLALALRGVFGCRVVIYVHGEEITTVTGGRLHGQRRADYLKAADQVVAVSAFTCDALTRLMQVPPEKIALIPNGVDTTLFRPGPPAAELIARHQLHGRRVILTVGRLVERKGVDMALRAVARLARARPDLHYLIVGEGPERARLEQIIADEGLAGRATLVGRVTQEDLLRYLQLCELFLMPNRTLPDGDTEGYGLVFREANACRKPVIGGRAGGAVEAVVDRVSGLLVDGHDADAIARAIGELLDDSALAQRCANQGWQLAQDNNTRAVAAQFLKVCERILARAD